ncbi:hypothetical protein BJX64DRAFT_63673 [Aspergillus heterothallicus]
MHAAHLLGPVRLRSTQPGPTKTAIDSASWTGRSTAKLCGYDPGAWALKPAIRSEKGTQAGVQGFNSMGGARIGDASAHLQDRSVRNELMKAFLAIAYLSSRKFRQSIKVGKRRD